MLENFNPKVDFILGFHVNVFGEQGEEKVAENTPRSFLGFPCTLGHWTLPGPPLALHKGSTGVQMDPECCQNVGAACSKVGHCR